MNNLTKNIRTHKAIMRDGSEIHLTLEQYQTIRLAKENRKSSDFITITCPDTGKIEYDGELGEIKKFIEKPVNNNSGYTATCSLGVRHPIINGQFECDCVSKMGIFEGDIINALNMIGYKVRYPVDITQEMRIELYKNIKKEGFKERLNNYIKEFKKE